MRLLYGVVLGGLVALLYGQWRIFPVTSPPLSLPPSGGVPVSNTSVVSTGTAFTFRLHNRETYDVISQRPLFSESRRPEEQQAPAPAPVAEQGLEGMELSAVLIRGARRTALVKDLKSKETLRLAQGDQVRGWTLSAIEQGYIKLALGDQASQLDLRVFAPPKPTSDGVPPAGPRPRRPPAQPTFRRPPGPVPGRTPHL